LTYIVLFSGPRRWTALGLFIGLKTNLIISHRISHSGGGGQLSLRTSVYIYTIKALIGKRGERVCNENFVAKTMLSIAYALKFSMWFPRTFSMLAINPECTWAGFQITRCTTSLRDRSSYRLQRILYRNVFSSRVTVSYLQRFRSINLVIIIALHHMV